MEQTQPSSLFQLNVDANNASTLRSAASWARVLGILGLIFGILMVAAGFIYKNAMSNSGGYDYYGYSRATDQMATVGLVACLLFGLLTIIGSIFALNFGTKISAALRNNDSNAMRTGFANVRNYFAFWSILMIIYLLLVIIGIASGGLTGAKY